MTRTAWLRLPILSLGMISLVVGVLAGFVRLALDMPTLAQMHAGEHGALMICAFFGTVISLERAVALRRGWPYLGPICAGLGGMALLFGAPLWLAQCLFLVASAALSGASLKVLFMQPSLFATVLLLGALLWLSGNLVWIGSASLAAAVPAWMAFLVVTIAGERLELTRLLPRRPGAQQLFLAALAVVVIGIAAALAGGDRWLPLFALGLLLLAIWLMRFDIARRNIRERKLPRFVAASLLSGYVWLAVGGAMGLAGALVPGEAWRDAALHAVFLGFVFSMVIGHAPIVLPAVMQVRLPYSKVLYLPLLALHASVFARVAAGMEGMWNLRQWAGIANAMSLALLIVTLLATLGLAASRRKTAA